jgi:hypothetical protein
MNRKTLLTIGAIVAIVVVGIAVWWLASPLFLSGTVNEQFPLSSNATLPPALNRPNAEATMVAAATLSSPKDEAMPPAAPVKVKTGQFRDGDGFHKGSGQVTVYKQADGTYLLRLENFKATNGPDLHVYLSPAVDPKTNDEVVVPGYVDLAVLKGNIGNQNYLIPAEVDLTKQNSVIIWCKAFSVVFSVAPLQQAG